jgi:hypothetical protein
MKNGQPSYPWVWASLRLMIWMPTSSRILSSLMITQASRAPGVEMTHLWVILPLRAGSSNSWEARESHSIAYTIWTVGWATRGQDSLPFTLGNLTFSNKTTCTRVLTPIKGFFSLIGGTRDTTVSSFRHPISNKWRFLNLFLQGQEAGTGPKELWAKDHTICITVSTTTWITTLARATQHKLKAIPIWWTRQPPFNNSLSKRSRALRSKWLLRNWEKQPSPLLKRTKKKRPKIKFLIPKIDGFEEGDVADVRCLWIRWSRKNKAKCFTVCLLQLGCPSNKCSTNLKHLTLVDLNPNLVSWAWPPPTDPKITHQAFFLLSLTQEVLSL